MVYIDQKLRLNPYPTPKQKFSLFLFHPLFPLPANCHVNFSSKPNNLYFNYIFFSLSKLPQHIPSLIIFTSFFCSTVTPTSCHHLRFVLLSSQACVSCCRSRFIVSFLSIFSFIFFLPSPFFSKISLSRYEKFSVFTFRLGRNGTMFKTLVHAVSEKRKKKDTARTPESGESYRYRSPTRVGHR